MDKTIMVSIDSVRLMVNNIKHDPLDYNVVETDYTNAAKFFATFWNKVMELEGMPAGLRG